jgi:hypothetical protein
MASKKPGPKDIVKSEDEIITGTGVPIKNLAKKDKFYQILQDFEIPLTKDGKISAASNLTHEQVATISLKADSYPSSKAVIAIAKILNKKIDQDVLKKRRELVAAEKEVEDLEPLKPAKKASPKRSPKQSAKKPQAKKPQEKASPKKTKKQVEEEEEEDDDDDEDEEDDDENDDEEGEDDEDDEDNNEDDDDENDEEGEDESQAESQAESQENEESESQSESQAESQTEDEDDEDDEDEEDDDEEDEDDDEDEDDEGEGEDEDDSDDEDDDEGEDFTADEEEEEEEEEIQEKNGFKIGQIVHIEGLKEFGKTGRYAMIDGDFTDTEVTCYILISDKSQFSKGWTPKTPFIIVKYNNLRHTSDAEAEEAMDKYRTWREENASAVNKKGKSIFLDEELPKYWEEDENDMFSFLGKSKKTVKKPKKDEQPLIVDNDEEDEVIALAEEEDEEPGFEIPEIELSEEVIEKLAEETKQPKSKPSSKSSSPTKSPKKSPKQSPKASPKTPKSKPSSKQASPTKSPKKSPKASPKSSPDSSPTNPPKKLEYKIKPKKIPEGYHLKPLDFEKTGFRWKLVKDRAPKESPADILAAENSDDQPAFKLPSPKSTPPSSPKSPKKIPFAPKVIPQLEYDFTVEELSRKQNTVGQFYKINGDTLQKWINRYAAVYDKIRLHYLIDALPTKLKMSELLFLERETADENNEWYKPDTEAYKILKKYIPKLDSLSVLHKKGKGKSPTSSPKISPVSSPKLPKSSPPSPKAQKENPMAVVNAKAQSILDKLTKGATPMAPAASVPLIEQILPDKPASPKPQNKKSQAKKPVQAIKKFSKGQPTFRQPITQEELQKMFQCVKVKIVTHFLTISG